jgi:hypothetical protein
MHHRGMSAEPPAKFAALIERLERAGAVLREGGCLLQAIARRYYLIYATATHLAANFGIAPLRRRDRERFEHERFTHNELPDLVYVLYTGCKSGNIGPADHAGIVGAMLHERQAEWVHRLQYDRMDADYGYSMTVEPHDPAETDDRLRHADRIITDLRTLLVNHKETRS